MAEATVPFDAAALALAEGLAWASTEGGPILLASQTAIDGWYGVWDAAGQVLFGTGVACDYDRACDADGAIGRVAVGAGQGLVLEGPDPAAWIARPDGALIVRTIACDDERHAVIAGLAATDEQFEAIEEDHVHEGGQVVLFDASLSGTELAKRGNDARMELPAGSYAISNLQEWQVEVLDQEGQPHETWVQVIRLRRR